MADRCNMRLTCAKRDQAVFEAIGFQVEIEWDDSDFANCVEMVDSDCASADNLPKDVVFFGTHTAGDCYGAEFFACDGQTYLEQACDDDGDSFAVTFDDEGDPDPRRLAEVKGFITHWNNVRVMLAKRRLGKRGHARPAQAPIIHLEKEQ